MFHGMANNLGPAADLSITKLQVADPKAHIDLSNETVDVSRSGDMAVYRATYAATSTDAKANRVVVERGNVLIGYRTGPDGTPKVAWDSFSDTPKDSRSRSPEGNDGMVCCMGCDMIKN